MTNHPAWAEVDLQAVARNVREISKITAPTAEIMAVVKANGYGHGAAEVARVALANGASRLAVARVEEGSALRGAGIGSPVLVLGYTAPGTLLEAIEHNLVLTVFSRDYSVMLNEEAGRLGVRVPVHIKVDTGMGRLGLLAGEPGNVTEALEIARLPHLEIEGVYTHFAAADSADKNYTRGQFGCFMEFTDQLRRQGLEVRHRHCANSAAIIDHPETHLDMVRLGISLYGLYPSEEVVRTRIKLYPAMSFKTRVAMVKSVPAGFKISYGCTYATPGPTAIATLPVGYADGYSRGLSSQGEVLIHGLRAPVVGRVCMDQCMVDVGHIPGVVPGDEVVLFGTQSGADLPVEEMAAKLNTINYEIVCMVSSRVPRVYQTGAGNKI